MELSEYVNINICVGFKNDMDDSYFVSRIFDGDDPDVGVKCWRIMRPNQEHNILG